MVRKSLTIKSPTDIDRNEKAHGQKNPDRGYQIMN